MRGLCFDTYKPIDGQLFYDYWYRISNIANCMIIILTQSENFKML